MVALILTWILCLAVQAKTVHVEDHEHKGHMSILQEGTWSPWAPWTCSTSCGHGILYRKRYCIPGKDVGFGIPDCEGAAVQRSPHPCDNKPCSSTKISKHNFLRRKPKFSTEEQESIRKHLKTHMAALIRKSDVQLNCGHQIIEMLTRSHANGRVTWSHNEDPLTFDIYRMASPELGKLIITHLTPKDNGVYICEFHADNHTSQILAVYSLIVETTEPDLVLKEGEKLELKCNCGSLTKLSKQLIVHWLHEGKAMLERPLITNEKVVSADVITNGVTMNSSGLWICYVKNPELAVNWMTNMVKVVVNRAPRRPGSTTMLFTILGGAILLLTIIVAAFIMCKRYGKSRKEKKQAGSIRKSESKKLLTKFDDESYE